MKKLRNKLKDQCGASILLALLFFLLCSMVGSSVLMAAVSNAGKIRSNRESQQDYLLLSSALRLVCDELTSAEYYGKYQYSTWSVDVTKGEGDAKRIVRHTYYKYTQVGGDFQCGLNSGLNSVLPLTEELDLIFASEFPESRDKEDSIDRVYHYIYEPLGGTFISTPHELTLNVDAPDVEGLDGAEKTVKVKVELDEDWRIRLTATLGQEEEGYIYTMEAQLTGQGSLGLDGAEDENQTGPMRWTLEWIAKKEAGDAA